MASRAITARNSLLMALLVVLALAPLYLVANPQTQTWRARRNAGDGDDHARSSRYNHESHRAQSRSRRSGEAVPDDELPDTFPEDPVPANMSEFDYIVVGAGPGGGTVAADLALAGYHVLLIEAGRDTGANPNFTVPFNHVASTMDPVAALDYFVQLNADRKRVLYPRAQGLGGCTLHHALISSPLPTTADWGRIRAETGDDSWEMDKMHGIWRDMTHTTYSPRYGNPCRHGYRGWLRLSQISLFAPPGELDPRTVLPNIALNKSMHTDEINDYLDPNCERNRDDAGFHAMVRSTYEGRRFSIRERLLSVKLRVPDRLTILKETVATRILLRRASASDEPVAEGVDVHIGRDLLATSPNASNSSPWTNGRYFARREVIVSGGTFETPKLLMLSGIGPREHLESQGIDVEVDLPGVGSNMQDRYEIAVVYNLSSPLLDPCQAQPGLCMEYWRDRKEWSLFAHNGPVFGVKWKTGFTKAVDVPDMYFFTAAARFNGYFPGYGNPDYLQLLQDKYTYLGLKTYSQNRAGTILLNSTDPHAQAKIDFKQFEQGADQDIPALLASLKELRRIGRVESLKQSLKDGLPDNFLHTELEPGVDVDTEEEMEAYIRNTTWGHHACCTAKIGNAKDAMAVLDSSFRVRKTRNLRVVDASAFPYIPGYFITVPLLNMAAKASGVIVSGADDACKRSSRCAVDEDDNKATVIALATILPILAIIILVLLWLRYKRQHDSKEITPAKSAAPTALAGAPRAQLAPNGTTVSKRPDEQQITDVQRTIIDIDTLFSTPESPGSTTTAMTSFGVSSATSPTPQPTTNGSRRVPARSNTISANRLRRAMSTASQRRAKESVKEKARMERLFALLDRDGDGVVTLEEFVTGIHSCLPGAQITTEEAHALFQALDTDEDQGTLSLTEWLEAVAGGSSTCAVLECDPIDIRFDNISCFYKNKKTGEERQVLHDITGNFAAGDFVALMGPSGAGKSTLLDILAQRKSTGRLAGAIYINGEPQTKQFLKHSAYVTQEDLFLPSQTVLETIMYHANLRLPTSMSREEKVERADALIAELGLIDQRDLRVGGPLPGGINVRGLSGGQKRRLAIACGLVASPSVLFLDEPTSGLDSGAALAVMSCMRQLSRKGITIICTIHQPRSAIWSMFDKLLLTAQGRLMYLGDASKAVPWFESLGFSYGTNSSEADWVIDLVTTDFDKDETIFGSHSIRNTDDLMRSSKAFIGSDAFRGAMQRGQLSALTRQLNVAASRGLQTLDGLQTSNGRDSHKYATSWANQYWILLRRAYQASIRNPGNVLARIFLVFVTGLVAGGANYMLENDLENVNSRLGILYFICVIYVLLPFANLSLFIYDRQFYSKEVASRLYSPSAYYTAAMTVETIFNCANVFVSATIAYFLIDLGNDFAHEGRQFGIYIAVVMLLHTVGNQWVQFCGLSMPNQDVAFSLGAAYVVTAQLFAGFLTAAENFSWLGFIQWIDFLKYAFNALARNEFETLDDNMDPRLNVIKKLAKLNEPFVVWVNVLALLGFWVLLHMASFLSLKHLHREQR